jgi:hypothetical protein
MSKIFGLHDKVRIKRDVIEGAPLELPVGTICTITGFNANRTVDLLPEGSLDTWALGTEYFEKVK